MPKIVVTKTYRYTPTDERRVSTTYKARPNPWTVNDDCARKAVATGYAVWPDGVAPAPRPPRKRRVTK